jgi:Phytanoyl-CoA dioxygenase (PhyH)
LAMADQQTQEEAVRAQFDEAAYLRMYPDIAAAVAEGRVGSGWQHYWHHGQHEGRLANEFDPEAYLRAYPAAVVEIAAGLAADPWAHYQRFGRARGFLPYPNATRPPNPAAMPSTFGGLWPDLPNALDLIEGKLEIGQISDGQAALLRFWVENGYVILPQRIAPDIVDAACADLDKAYAGGFPGLRFECHRFGTQHMPWRAEFNPHPSKALDLHHFSSATRDLMLADPIVEFLGLIFESKVFASQTLGFLRGSAQEGHQDSAYVPYTLPRQFAASWVALEDVTLGAGELFYYPGSHLFPDFLYAGRWKSVAEAARLTGTNDVGAEVAEHVRGLEARARELGLRKMPLAARKGEVLIWHADLVHGANPVSSAVTRKSVVTHYCPKRVAPLFSERVTTGLWERDGHYYTTSYYLGQEPSL